jgi:hypothetical protein
MNPQQIDQTVRMLQNVVFYFRDNWLALAAFILSIVSLAITWRKNIVDRRYVNDKELVDQLKQSLQLAYMSLVTGDDKSPPTNSRLRWLTSARHISRYRALNQFLKTSLYRTISAEQEEYWRNRIYNLLQRIDDSKFFECINMKEMMEERIEPKSAAIVYSFSVWKEGMPDPLDSMNFEEIVERYELFSPLHRPFREYIERCYPGLAKKANKDNS